MKTKKLYLIAFVCALVMYSCKRNDISPPQKGVPVENYSEVSLTDSDDTFLASLTPQNNTDKDIVLPNGVILEDYLKKNPLLKVQSTTKILGTTVSIKSAQDNKISLISLLTSGADRLTDRKSFAQNFPEQPNGLAYVWGGKDPSVKKASSYSKGGICDEKMYGLDCSGFVNQVALAAGLILTPNYGEANVAFLKNSQNWEKSLVAKGYEKLHMEDIKPGTISETALESGDIIYWNDANNIGYHIGIVLTNTKQEKVVYMSSGKPELSCTEASSKRRGPTQLLLNDINKWGKRWGILRLTIEISGNWAFYVRCADRNQDLFKLDLNFPITQTNTFNLSQTATDYDGSTNLFKFKFNYNKLTNNLSCEYSMTDSEIPNFERQDKFNTKLYTDDTGYITVTNVLMKGGSGCTEEIKLVNKAID